MGTTSNIHSIQRRRRCPTHAGRQPRRGCIAFRDYVTPHSRSRGNVGLSDWGSSPRNRHHGNERRRRSQIRKPHIRSAATYMGTTSNIHSIQRRRRCPTHAGRQPRRGCIAFRDYVTPHSRWRGNVGLSDWSSSPRNRPAYSVAAQRHLTGGLLVVVGIAALHGGRPHRERAALEGYHVEAEPLTM